MAQITPSVLANTIMSKLYDVLMNGDSTAPSDPNNFFSWCTPGVPVEAEDFDFLTQGFTPQIKFQPPQQLDNAVKNAGNEKPTADGASTKVEARPPTAAERAELNKQRALATARLWAQAESFARLVDFVPSTAQMTTNGLSRLSVTNNNGTLSEIYLNTLIFSRVADTPLTDAEKKQIKDWRARLQVTKKTQDLSDPTKTVESQVDSPLVTAYVDKQKAYGDAVLAYNNARIAALNPEDATAVNSWALNAKTLRDNVKTAMSQWVSAGYKNQYEQIVAAMAQMEGRSLVTLKANYLDDMEKARATGLASGSDFFLSSLVPGSFVKSSGWAKFTFDAATTDNLDVKEFKKEGWTGNAKAEFWDLFRSISARGSGGSDKTRIVDKVKFDSDFCKMEFEVCQVPIVRPWFKPSFLKSKLWKREGGLNTDPLSDGKTPPGGLLPAYPTSIIFIRKLVFKFGDSEELTDALTEIENVKGEGNAVVGLGPFSFSGSVSRNVNGDIRNKSFKSKRTSEGIEVPGMQIIGYKCETFTQQMPNPDSNIKNWI